MDEQGQYTYKKVREGRREKGREGEERGGREGGRKGGGRGREGKGGRGKSKEGGVQERKEGEEGGLKDGRVGEKVERGRREGVFCFFLVGLTFVTYTIIPIRASSSCTDHEYIHTLL